MAIDTSALRQFLTTSRREVRDPGSLISCSRRIRLPPLQTILRPCNQFRAGWALVSPTLCKSAVHSEVVRIHPCPPSSCHHIRGRSSMAEHHVANVGTMGSISHRPLHFAQHLATTFRTSSSAVERRVEGARVGGSIPSLCTISGP